MEITEVELFIIVSKITMNKIKEESILKNRVFFKKWASPKLYTWITLSVARIYQLYDTLHQVSK